MAITQVDPNNFSLQVYDSQDESLIPSSDIDTVLTSSGYFEFFIYENDSTLAFQNYSYINYSVENDSPSTGLTSISQFNIDPETDCQNLGFDRGDYIAYYNFLNKEIGNINQKLYITEISSDRTEIRLDSNVLSNLDIVEQTNAFVQKRENSEYFLDFYLNFGNNDLLISNNVKIDNEDTTDPTVLIKLYEPLPPEFDLKDELWVVTTLNESEAFRVSFPNQVIDFDDTIRIQGPNLNLPIKEQINNSTQNLSYTDLIASSTTSSFQQLKSLISSSAVQISIDYSDFDDFIHFSSAKTRLENFNYKVGLIEGYSASISDLSGISSSATSVNILENKIGNIKQNFDGFEYYLYYSSGSTTYPKTTSIQPYKLATTGSTAALTWLGSDNEGSTYFGGQILSASNFDNQNPDNLLFSIPEYLRDDAANQPYDLFVSMVGQHFDDIWVYTKDITQKYNADNRLDYGVSKDLVADAIRDFGIKLYQNNFSKDDLYTAFLGMTPNGALFPFPDITGSLPVPTGYEYVDTMISASTTSIPLDDVNKSIYKRIYHNLPYLIQSKGTIPGLRALITSYGIPDTILKISEFGGKDKANTNDWDYYFNKFNYAYEASGSNFLYTFNYLNSDWNLGTYPNYSPIPSIEFRFKAENFPPTNLSQSLLTITDVSDVPKQYLTLEYAGSGSISGSYSASIKDPYYQYANLKFYPSASDSNVTASVYLPFFDGGWWSVLINSGSGGYELFAKNKIYNGKDGTQIGYQSSSIITTTSPYPSRTRFYFASSSLFPGFSGSLQEIRYWNTQLSESSFNDYVMNPLSIEGNTINSSPNELIFRASLGSELNTSTLTTQVSIHPKVTGSWATTSSFISGTSTYKFPQTPTFVPNTEYYFLDQPAVGIKNRITDKVRFENNVVPTGSVLSPYRRVTQQTEASASYTPHINLLEVAFSPQNEINDDIIGQLGYFNVGDYIGDPRQRSSSLDYYPDLNALRDAYFEKYIKNYDLVDFVRLIKFFDNSLFRMIKDFIPARTSLASGLVIKQHLLERNKYPQPQLDIDTEIAKYAKSGSILYNQPISQQNLLISGTVAPQWNDYKAGTISNLTGGPGGNVNKFNSLTTSPLGSSGSGPNNSFNVTQSWDYANSTLSGSIIQTQETQDEFYNGEYSGSIIIATNGELNPGCDPFKNVNIKTNIPYAIRTYLTKQYPGGTAPLYNEDWWEDSYNQPLDGYISLSTQDAAFTVDYENVLKGGGLTNDTSIKISKTDANGKDQSLPLRSITRFYFTEGSFSKTFSPYFYQTYFDVDPDTIQEFPNYYLYTTNYNTTINSFFTASEASIPQWNFTGSYTGDGNTKISGSTRSPEFTTNTDNSTVPNIFLNPYSHNYTTNGTNTIESYGMAFDFPTYYERDLIVEFSGSITASNDSQNGFIFYINSDKSGSGDSTSPYYPQNFPVYLPFTSAPFNSQNYTGSFSGSAIISSSQYPPGSNLGVGLIPTPANLQKLKAVNGISTLTWTSSINDFTLNIYESPVSTRPATTFSKKTFNASFEPFFQSGDTDWNRSLDCHAIYGNIQDNRKNTFLQDIDYSTGLIVPTNITALINDNATKATVPDSNYTALKVINPRYLGSRSTCKELNKWQVGDKGTYGKEPNIQSQANLITYCDWIDTTIPQHNAKSKAHIKYIIKNTGEIEEPNLTDISLGNIQKSFPQEQNCIVALNEPPVGIGMGVLAGTKEIFKGGYRIEPILSTQSGSLYNSPSVVHWTGSNMVGEDKSNSLIPNYSFLSQMNSTQQVGTNVNGTHSQTTKLAFNVSVSNEAGNYNNTTYEYTAVEEIANEGIRIKFSNRNVLKFVLTDGRDINDWYYLNGKLRLMREDPDTTITTVEENNFDLGAYQQLIFPYGESFPPGSTAYLHHFLLPDFTSNFIPPSGSKYYAEFEITYGYPLQQVYVVGMDDDLYVSYSGWPVSYFKLTQNPAPTSNFAPGSNDIWGYPRPSDFSVITASGVNSIINTGYENYTQINIPGSGFVPFSEKWELKPGDEFRFEDREDMVFSVQSIISPSSHPSGTLQVQLDNPIPSSSINLDHFLIRRYVPDPSIIIFDESKPPGDSGTAFVRPEYVTKELDKDISEISQDLTQKGLIT